MHAEPFPAALAAGADAALLARWDRLLRLREEVTAALEVARRERRIGSSLEATVALDGPPEVLEFLRSFGAELRFLFLTSGVVLGEAGAAAQRSESVPELWVEVRCAAGRKCERCWHWTDDVGHDPAWPGICARCAASVRRILVGPAPA